MNRHSEVTPKQNGWSSGRTSPIWRTGRVIRAVLLVIAGFVLVAATCEFNPFPSSTASPAALPPRSTTPRIYTNLADPPSLKQDYGSLGVEKTLIMMASSIDPGNTGRWQAKDRTDAWLRKHCPTDYRGILVLDWEGKVFEPLKKGPQHPDFEQSVTEMVRLIKYVKSQRPAAQLGYYSLPIREYYNQTDEWRTSMKALKPIYDASDAIFPSVYDFYGSKPARDHERHAEVVRLALEVADGKPVYLYMMHRYHFSTDRWGDKLIPDDEYVAHIRYLLHNVSHDGARPAGVVAWGADRYWYGYYHKKKDGRFVRDEDRAARFRRIFREERRANENLDRYLDRIHRRVYVNLGRAVQPTDGAS